MKSWFREQDSRESERARERSISEEHIDVSFFKKKRGCRLRGKRESEREREEKTEEKDLRKRQ